MMSGKCSFDNVNCGKKIDWTHAIWVLGLEAGLEPWSQAFYTMLKLCQQGEQYNLHKCNISLAILSVIYVFFLLHKGARFEP